MTEPRWTLPFDRKGASRLPDPPNGTRRGGPIDAPAAPARRRAPGVDPGRGPAASGVYRTDGGVGLRLGAAGVSVLGRADAPGMAGASSGVVLTADLAGGREGRGNGRRRPECSPL